MRATTHSIGMHAALLAAGLFATAASAQNWPNIGGNSARNGLTTQAGPDAATLLWTMSRPSVIAWQPLIDGDRVFIVRQTGFPPSGEPNGSPIFAYNLDTGAQLWRAERNVVDLARSGLSQRVAVVRLEQQ